MSNKILITLTILFIINCDCTELQECIDELKKAGFSDEIGFLNFIISKKFNVLNDFQLYLRNMNFSVDPENRYITMFFNENIKIQSGITLKDPKVFCSKRRELKEFNCRILNIFLDSVSKCTAKINKSYESENAYINSLKSMDILLSNAVDKKAPELFNCQDYATLLKELPAIESLDEKGYIEILNKRAKQEKMFKKYYTNVQNLNDRALEYWYYHITILKRISARVESSYLTTVEWCKLKYTNFQSEVSNISTE